MTMVAVAKGIMGIPWFIHSLLNPPQDPMTIQLLALVEDLDPIPGPQSIGSVEFSIVFRAFMDRGWEGFEEAFDSIVSRSRTDYVDVKCNLLRDSIFNRRGHRNAARLMLGEATLEQLRAESPHKIASGNEQ
jgi:hypothetical protein